MSKSLAREIGSFLEANPEYESWERLTEYLQRRSADLPADAVIKASLDLWKRGDQRFLWAASTLLYRHPTALRRIRWRALKEMGDRVDNWGSADVFALMAGTAWRARQISDARIQSCTRSENRWWRRAALVCTVALNRRSWGGKGDATRTLAVCERLAADRDDMVVKAMSWALRELIAVDRRAVERFMKKHDDVLAARVKREVRNKLETGLKNPRLKRRSARRRRSV
jgi:3-methyladenine DNA glycosylase AlkD